MSDPVAIALIGAVSGLVAAVGTVFNTWLTLRTKKAITTLEKNTNSIKDELVRVTGQSEHAKGVIQGRQEGKGE